MLKKLLLLTIVAALTACQGARQLPGFEGEGGWKTLDLTENARNWSGDQEQGFTYLVNGDYIGTGVPFSFLEKKLAGSKDNYRDPAHLPPRWNIRKKNALHYNGMGRGDFAKLLMQASVPGIPDSAYARKVHQGFIDVVAWAVQPEPPPYPYKLVSLEIVKTDPYYARYFSASSGLPGYGKQGHYFGDKLSEEERRAVVKFLKPL